MKYLEAKVVLLGSQAVGKTSVVIRCLRDRFDTRVGPTIGAAFFAYKLAIGNYQVNLQIWDTAGQERFKSMAPMYYRRASAAILVFDICDEATFYALKGWVGEFKRNLDRPSLLFVFGNKCDLDDKRKVTGEAAKAYALSIGAEYFETSALSGTGIAEGFRRVANALVEHHEIGGERSYLSVYQDGSPSTAAGDSRLLNAAGGRGRLTSGGGSEAELAAEPQRSTASSFSSSSGGGGGRCSC